MALLRRSASLPLPLSIAPLLAALLAARGVLAAVPAPLPLLCQPTLHHGCFNDSWTRTFPYMVSNGGPDDAFGLNATQETCAYLCKKDNASWTAAAIENGAQCFCSDAAGIARAAALSRPAKSFAGPMT